MKGNHWNVKTDRVTFVKAGINIRSVVINRVITVVGRRRGPWMRVHIVGAVTTGWQQAHCSAVQS